MDIETLEDWNARLACCCTMPTCPTPSMECQSITVSACGFSLPAHEDLAPADACKIFKTKTNLSTVVQSTVGISPGHDSYTAEDTDIRASVLEYSIVEGSCTLETVSSSFNSTETINVTNYSGEVTVDITTVTTLTYLGDNTLSGTVTGTDGIDPENNYSEPIIDAGPPYDHDADATWSVAGTTYTFHSSTTTGDVDGPGSEETTLAYDYSIEYSSQVDADALATQLTTAIADLGEEDWPGSGCFSSVTTTKVFNEAEPPEIICSQVSGATAVRYRWQIPASHTGNYFKITWDVVTEPTDGVPTLESDVGTWEWAGPGNAEDPDDASWFSGWYDLDPPAEPGTKRVVNVRFECYRSPYGNKPQLTGEGYELPA